MKSEKRPRKRRDVENGKIDQDIALISANLSMKKCMNSLDRLEEQNQKLRAKANMLQRNLDAERITAWIQLNNDRRDATNLHRERCFCTALRRRNLMNLRDAWGRWLSLVHRYKLRQRAARKMYVYGLSFARNCAREALWRWKTWCQNVEIERLHVVLQKALKMSEIQVAFANEMITKSSIE